MIYNSLDFDERHTATATQEVPGQRLDETDPPQSLPSVDWRLIAQVNRLLELSGYTSLREIEVNEREGNITLWGRVSSYYLKQMAQSLALQVPGVQQVINGILVDAADDAPTPRTASLIRKPGDTDLKD